MERFSTLLVGLSIVVGIPYFFLDQHLKREQEKAANTLEFVKKFQESELVGDRFALLMSWEQYGDLKIFQYLSDDLLDAHVMKIFNAERERRANTAAENSKTDIRQATFRLVEFFETLNICIEIARCNQKIASDYLAEYANRFYCLYRPYIIHLRMQYLLPKYGERLESFALQHRKCRKI